MVLPKPHRSHVASADHIEESNSTASLFLGGVRRNWMGPQANAPENSGTRPRNLSRVDLPDPPNPNSLPHELTLMSPVTPGETLQNQSSSRGPAVNPAKKPDTPQATALPSPVLSTTSHPSPVSAEVIISNSSLPSISTRLSARGEDERMADQPRSPREPVEQRATQNPPGRTTLPQTKSPLICMREHGVPSQHGPQLQNGDAGVVIIDEIWMQWLAQLDSLVADLDAKGALPPANSREPNVVRPRIDLLRQAITRKDSFYLVIHQLYCCYSIDPSTLGQIGAPEARMQMLVPLLEDNGKMHGAATIGFAHFPAPLQYMMEMKWHHPMVSTVVRFLSRLDVEWVNIWQQAPHPPLVANLWAKLALPSPILMLVMFLCVARRLHSETCIRSLTVLFWQDFDSFTPRGEATQQTLNRQFVQEYLKFPRLPDSPSQTPESPAVPRIETMSPAVSGTPTHPRPSIAVGRPTNAFVPSPVGEPYGNHTATSPQGQVMAPAVSYQNFSTQPTQMQYPQYPQYRFFNPTHGQAGGQWQQTQIQMQQLHRQRALGQVYPSMHQPLQIPQGHQMQRQTMTPTTSISPANAQPVTINPTQSAHPFPNPSPISTHTPTTPASTSASIVPTSHPMVYSTSQRPHDHLNRQQSITPHSHAPAQGHNFQHLPNSSLLPPPGYRAPMTVNPNPMRLGLHLADLRDPMKRLLKQDSDGNESATELFFYLDSFVVRPTVINPEQSIYTWAFSLTRDECQKFPAIVQGEEGRSPVWTFKPGCRTYRLRCIRVPGKSTSVPGRTWSVGTTFWPSVFYITVNDKELSVRRKLHNGKDLALDITEHLQTGENNIRVDFILGEDECKNIKFAFGVEVMQVAEFDKILSMIQLVPAADSRAAIQKRLSPTTDDEELAVVTDSLTIGLVDPFMARIFNVPVRSRNCRHHECFDRDNFIQTRKSVSGQAPMMDDWRCPICKVDARPQFLVVDQFFVEVHAELARTERLDVAKAIQIKVDGTWSLKTNSDDTSLGANKHISGSTAVKRKAESMSSSPRPSGPRPKTETSSAQRRPIVRTQEPIELD